MSGKDFHVAFEKGRPLKKCGVRAANIAHRVYMGAVYFVGKLLQGLVLVIGNKKKMSKRHTWR